MKSYIYIIASLLFMGTLFTAQAQDTEQKINVQEISTQKIEVYYFHNTRRCATCEAVESVTKSALKENYAEQMENGKITFQSLNVEDDANEPLARKLKVSGQTLLFVKDGKRKDLTNDAFMYARTNPEKLTNKIIKTVDALESN